MSHRKSLIFLVLTGIFCAQVSWSAETFPFLAEITQDGVNIRAGQNQNFERLTQLRKGDEIIVLAKSFNWYKVELPTTADVYISDKYVSNIGGKEGRITKDNVNLRAGPGINFSVVGQASTGDTLNILDFKDGWYKVEPIPQTYGWVQEGLLAFKSRTLPRIPQVSPEVVKNEGEVNVIQQIIQNIESIPAGPVKVAGDLVSGKDPSGKAVYKIVDPPQSYVINGLTSNLDTWVGLRVEAEGTVRPPPEQATPLILNVSKIQLIL